MRGNEFLYLFFMYLKWWDPRNKKQYKGFKFVREGLDLLNLLLILTASPLREGASRDSAANFPGRSWRRDPGGDGVTRGSDHDVATDRRSKSQ